MPIIMAKSVSAKTIAREPSSDCASSRSAPEKRFQVKRIICLRSVDILACHTSIHPQAFVIKPIDFPKE
jgi:hypothetical protein